jgi:hypothetical protein
MSIDYRALCVELLQLEQEQPAEYTDWKRRYNAAIARVRAALAQPEPVAPTDEALANFSGWFCRNYPGPDTIIHKPEWHAPKVFRAAADAIARYARPTIEPVPVSERLPEVGDWVWHCYAGVRFWEHGRYNGRQFFIGDGPESQPATHWLPANALPTPEAP